MQREGRLASGTPAASQLLALWRSRALAPASSSWIRERAAPAPAAGRRRRARARPPLTGATPCWRGRGSCRMSPRGAGEPAGRPAHPWARRCRTNDVCVSRCHRRHAACLWLCRVNWPSTRAAAGISRPNELLMSRKHHISRCPLCIGAHWRSAGVPRAARQQRTLVSCTTASSGCALPPASKRAACTGRGVIIVSVRVKLQPGCQVNRFAIVGWSGATVTTHLDRACHTHSELARCAVNIGTPGRRGRRGKHRYTWNPLVMLVYTQQQYVIRASSLQ